MLILKDIFTGPDNKTVELAHVVWVLAVLSFIGVSVYIAVKTATYPTNFGQDFGLLNAGGAAGAYARAKSDQTLGR